MSNLLPTWTDRGFSRFETLLDYRDRVDAQPVYIGRAAHGTKTQEQSWMIERIEYDAVGRPIRKQAFTGSWDRRANLK